MRSRIRSSPSPIFSTSFGGPPTNLDLHVGPHMPTLFYARPPEATGTGSSRLLPGILR